MLKMSKFCPLWIKRKRINFIGMKTNDLILHGKKQNLLLIKGSKTYFIQHSLEVFEVI
jgi:hypothetical protein